MADNSRVTTLGVDVVATGNSTDVTTVGADVLIQRVALAQVTALGIEVIRVRSTAPPPTPRIIQPIVIGY